VIERLKAEKVEAVAVSFLWSIVNSAHELQMAALLDRHLPGVPYTLGTGSIQRCASIGGRRPAHRCFVETS